MSEVPFVQDLRGAGDPSFDLVPFVSTYDELVAKFNLNVRRDKGWDVTPAGQACWKLIGFYLRTGIASYIARVNDVAGTALPNILVLRHWSGADQFTSTITPAYATNGVAGWTNGNGDAGFPYAGSSVVMENGGPDMIWVSASPPGQQPQYSDAVERLGWFGGTDHLTPNPIFQYTVKGGEPVPEGEYELRVVVNGEVVGKIPLLPTPTGESYLALYKGSQELGRAIIQ